MSSENDFIVENGVLKKYTGIDKEAVIPNSVTSIGEEAFYRCASLTSITIPNSVTRIGKRAFEYCESLTSITIPDGVTSIGEDAFNRCASLASITIPNSVTRIGERAFKYCESLTSITIPDGVTSIGEEAFYGCESLTSITIPNSVTRIGIRAFRYCTSLTSITIPDGVTSIGDEAFFYCKSLTSITIPDGVTSIGDGAFYICASLTSITIPNSVTSIGESAFQSCASLASITIPNSVTSIGEYAFQYCKSLTSITIPNSVTSIGEDAFTDCKSLTSITIPDSVTSISKNTFLRCDNLASVTIPDSVTSIGDAFYGCKNLTSITIPDSVTSISKGFFPGWAVSLSDDKAEWFIKKSGMSALLIIREKAKTRFIAATAKNNGDKLLKDVLNGEYEQYDLELINNGPNLKVKAEIRLIAALARMCEPAGMRNDLRDIFAEMIRSNAKKYVPAAEKLLMPEIITMLLSSGILDEKNLKAVRKLITASSVSEIAVLSDSEAGAATTTTVKAKTKETEKDPLASEFEEKFKVAQGDEIITKMKLIGSIFPRVCFKNGSEAPEELLRFIIVSYGSQFISGDYHFDKEADSAVALLSYDSLCNAIETISGNLDAVAYPSLIPMICRYGNRKQIRTLIGAQKEWHDNNKSDKKWRDAEQTFNEAIMLSETREAVVWVEMNGDIKKYAEMRGKTPDDIYNEFLFDFGFDENCKRVFNLGVTQIEAVLTSDMKIDLFDITTGKAIKSLPKKGTDPELYKKLSDELSDMSGNLKKVLKIKSNQLWSDYIEGISIPAEKWKKTYFTNPFLRNIASLIVWMQGEKTFVMCKGGALTDFSGKEYVLDDKPILIAHPMEIKRADVEAWQGYFSMHGLKQPFMQIWEPVIDKNMVRSDRYAGCAIRSVYLKNQQKRGISFDAPYYGSDLAIEGFDVTASRIYDSKDVNYDHVEIETIISKKWCRRANMIISYLDRITVFERIRKDDISVMKYIDGCNAAQITEYINAANEAKAVNVLVALMEYKHIAFPGVDSMARFTLD